MAARNYLISTARCAGVAALANVAHSTQPIGYLTAETVTDNPYNRLVVRADYTVSGLWVRITANTITGNTTYQFCVNSTTPNSNNSVVVPSTQTGAFQDTTHTDSLLSGQSIYNYWLPANSGTSITTTIIASIFQSASADVTIIACSMSAVVGGSITTYTAVIGINMDNTTEVNASYLVRVAGTLSNMYVYVYDNYLADSVFTSRVNGGAGNQTITVPGSTSGAFEDTTHTDSVAAGQTIGRKLVTGAGAGLIYTGDGISFKWASIGQILGNSYLGSGYATVPYGHTWYFAPGDDMETPTSEINGQVLALFASVIKNLFVYCRVFTLTVAILYEHCNTGDTAGETFNGIYWRAQTFTPAADHTIEKVKLLLYRNGTPGTVTVSIRATDVNGHPTGGDLCSGTTDGDTLPTAPTYEWRTITLGAGTPLSAGLKYAIVVRCGGGINEVGWRYVVPSGYAGGNDEYSGDSGGTWATSANADWMFEEWGPGSPVAATVTFRQNAGDTALTVTVTGTGSFEDTTHSVTLAATDLIDVKVDSTGASSGSAGLTYIGYELDQPSAPPGVQGKGSNMAAKLVAAGAI